MDSEDYHFDMKTSDIKIPKMEHFDTGTISNNPTTTAATTTKTTI